MNTPTPTPTKLAPIPVWLMVTRRSHALNGHCVDITRAGAYFVVCCERCGATARMHQREQSISYRDTGLGLRCREARWYRQQTPRYPLPLRLAGACTGRGER